MWMNELRDTILLRYKKKRFRRRVKTAKQINNQLWASSQIFNITLKNLKIILVHCLYIYLLLKLKYFLWLSSPVKSNLCNTQGQICKIRLIYWRYEVRIRFNETWNNYSVYLSHYGLLLLCSLSMMQRVLDNFVKRNHDANRRPCSNDSGTSARKQPSNASIPVRQKPNSYFNKRWKKHLERVVMHTSKFQSMFFV